jgi:sulfate permease, SulP family
VDSAQNARTVREDTAELASYLLSDRQSQGSPSFFLQRSRLSSEFQDVDSLDEQTRVSETIQEVSEPSTPGSPAPHGEEDGPSALTNLLRESPPQSVAPDASGSSQDEAEESSEDEEEEDVSRHTAPRRNRKSSDLSPSEHTPLLRRETTGGLHDVDLEGQKGRPSTTWFGNLTESVWGVERHVAHTIAIAANPKHWDHKAIWQTAVVTPASCLPAVCVGLLLNILDALSYGKPVSSSL